MSHRLAVLSAVVLSTLSLASSTATAGERAFPGERFEPAMDGEGIIGVDWADVPAHLSWDVGLWLGYENDPLYTYRDSPLFVPPPQSPLVRADSLVENRVFSYLTGNIALYDWVSIGAELPVVLFQSRDEGRAPAGDAGDLGAVGVGDLELSPKVRILSQARGAPVDLGASLPITLPSGQFFDFMGEEGLTVTPTMLVSRRFGDFRIAGNVGHRFRGEEKYLDLTLGNELIYKAGAAYRFTVVEEHPTEVGVALVGAAATDALFRGDNAASRNPVELLADLSYRIWGPLDVVVGGGAGLISGYGTPDFRVFTALRWSERPPEDFDGDGIVGDADRCPRQPENKNGVEDEDGCPDSGDDDHDGIANLIDKCPNAPEDKDGFEDSDGCPDFDHDKDGVPNQPEPSADKCPTDAEDKDGFEDDDGCPDLDNDGDGIADASDKCPIAAEDKDGFEDDDGCPDEDNDKDGFADAADQCPNEAGIKQNKGCPDRDRDGDTVVDRLDNCPDEKGTPENGGCATKQLVVITDAKLQILDKVYFQFGSDQLDPKSFPLLDNVAAVIKAHPELAKVRIEGHTDNVGSAEKNLDLSKRRAESVRKYLIGKGVEEARLLSEGFGLTKPIATNDTDAGRQENRRVEFVIVEE